MHSAAETVPRLAARPCRRRTRRAATRAGLLESATTLAEASVALGVLQLGRKLFAPQETAAGTAGAAWYQAKYNKLAISVAIDAFGAFSYLLPGLGEATDAVWAPLSAGLINTLYASKLLALTAFVEEALPWTDALPTASIGWILEQSPLGGLVGLAASVAKPKDSKAR